ncbi:nucleotidyltransferase domain-containing protein [Candidatus Wolfebacteria bacterium]|nr:nucleotidyltransferase domain-containing protein [Candidatus Wolfebacteria bacterium]
MTLDIKKLKLKTEPIAEKYNLRLAILYGSFAKNLAKEESDIDIAVLGKRKISFQEEIDIINEFISVGGEFGIKEVDIKSLHNVSPLFRFQVMKNGVLLYGDNHYFNSFKVYAFRDYHDSQDLLALKDIIINKRMASLKNI